MILAMRDIQKYDAVVSPDGRVGMVSTLRRAAGFVIVQFGADGPFEHYRPQSLRWATAAEVREAGREGVGGLTVRL